VKLHTVISDITGATGLRIIRAILAGIHDPHKLAAMRDPACRSSEQTIAKALMGNYRQEHLFALRQALDLFETYHQKLLECDEAIAAELARFEKQADGSKLAPKPEKRPRKNQPQLDGRTLLFEMAGVDLTAIDGLEVSTVLTVLSETGIDMSPWPSQDHFSAWLALAPNNRITGGKRIRKNQPKIHPNRAAQAFRLAAQTLEKSQSALGAFFRRVQSRLGRSGAIKATAHKLAVIVYSMLKNKTPYRDLGANYYETRYRDRLINSLKKKAATLGFNLIPVQEVH
jgi:transposase